VAKVYQHSLSNAGPSTSQYHAIVVSKISPFFTFTSVQIKLVTFLRTNLVVLQGIQKKSFCALKLNQPQFVYC